MVRSSLRRYGRPDPLLRREHDVRVSLQMASVQYVHTQRFQAEVVAFIQHFTQLQDVLGRQRAAIEGQTVGHFVSELLFWLDSVSHLEREISLKNFTEKG